MQNPAIVIRSMAPRSQNETQYGLLVDSFCGAAQGPTCAPLAGVQTPQAFQSLAWASPQATPGRRPNLTATPTVSQAQVPLRETVVACYFDGTTQ
jgi:hypothetical protein